MALNKIRVILFTIISGALFNGKVLAQKADSAVIRLSGYVDAYYGYYTDSVGDGNFQRFPSIAPRSQQFGLNTAMITASYDAEKVRGQASFHFGDISRSAWSATYPNIMEVHAGVRLCKQLWVDAGFFRTHFGTEGLLPIENICSSVSIGTFHEPYYEAGARVQYNPNDKFSINLYVLNGYNLYEDNNKKKSFGLLATYTLGNKGNIGYSNYIGDDTPTAADSISHLRIHNNLFVNYQFGKLKAQVGGDFCVQEHSQIANPKNSATMYSGLASVKYQCCPKFAVYARGEVFNDPEGFMGGIITDTTGLLTGYKLWAVTAGMEYKPTGNSYIRLESRNIEMDGAQQVFHWKGDAEDSRLEIILNMGIAF